jgi:hypothetical protein
MNKISLALLLTAVLITPSLAGEKMTMAIMDFEGRDVSRSDASKVSELIRTELVNTGEYILVERSQVDKILREQGFQMTGCTDVACAVQVGKLLSARKILVGSVMKIGDTITIAGRVVDVQRGINEFGEKVAVESKNELVYGVEQFCEKLTARITGKAPVKKKEEKKKSEYKYEYYTYSGSSYDAISDPTGWLALGSFLAGGIICAGNAISYKTKSTSIKMDIDSSTFMMSGSLTAISMGFGTTDSIMALYFLKKIRDKKKDLLDARHTRNTVYYVAAGFGGFAAVMFVTFIARYASSSVAVNEIPGPGQIALSTPVLDSWKTGIYAKNNFNLGLGLSASW